MSPQLRASKDAYNSLGLLFAPYSSPQSGTYSRSHCGCRARLQMIIQSSLVFSQGWGLIDLPLRATFSPAHPLARRDVPLARARAFDFPHFALGGAARLSFTARIGRAPFYRARSASTKDGLVAPLPSFLRPRVARAQKIIRLHPCLSSLYHNL